MSQEQTHTRALPAPLEVDVESRTAEGLIVPWDREAEIIEQRGDRLIRYREVFEPGSLDRALRVPHRVGLFYTHEDSLANRLGYAVEFQSREDGMHATFRLDRSRAEQALDLLTTSHQALSIAFRSILPKPLTETEGSVVVRRSVHLMHVAAVTEPAYSDARVLSAREDVDDEPTEAEKAEAQRASEAERLLAEVREVVARGDRWAEARKRLGM